MKLILALSLSFLSSHLWAQCNTGLGTYCSNIESNFQINFPTASPDLTRIRICDEDRVILESWFGKDSPANVDSRFTNWTSDLESCSNGNLLLVSTVSLEIAHKGKILVPEQEFECKVVLPGAGTCPAADSQVALFPRTKARFLGN